MRKSEKNENQRFKIDFQFFIEQLLLSRMFIPMVQRLERLFRVNHTRQWTSNEAKSSLRHFLTLAGPQLRVVTFFVFSENY